MAEQTAAEAGASGTLENSKKPKMVEKDYDEDQGSVTFTFASGQELEIRLDELDAKIVKRLALHGLVQKGGDSYAGEKDVNAAYEAVQKVYDQLKAGEWRSGGAAGEGKPRIGELAHAIAKVMGKPVEEVVAIVQAADDAKRKSWRQVPAVQAAIADIRAAKARELATKAGAVTLQL